MKEDHESGRCYACNEDKPVQWKNLYTIGSEGTWLCMPCELVIVNLLRKMASDAISAGKERYMSRKMRQHAVKRSKMKKS